MLGAYGQHTFLFFSVRALSLDVGIPTSKDGPRAGSFTKREYVMQWAMIFHPAYKYGIIIASMFGPTLFLSFP